MNVSAIFGLLGSFFLAIPAVRAERRRRKYANFRIAYRSVEEDHGEADQELARRIEEFEIRSSIIWNVWDSFFVLSGLALIVLSFLLEIF